MPRPTKAQKRIREAKALLANETLHDIFDTREQEIVDRWKASNTTEKRESCYYEIIALGELRDAIDATASG